MLLTLVACHVKALLTIRAGLAAVRGGFAALQIAPQGERQFSLFFGLLRRGLCRYGRLCGLVRIFHSSLFNHRYHGLAFKVN